MSLWAFFGFIARSSHGNSCLCDRVVNTKFDRLAAGAMIRNPIDPAVTDVAEDYEVTLDNCRGEGARGGILTSGRSAVDYRSIGRCSRLHYSV